MEVFNKFYSQVSSSVSSTVSQLSGVLPGNPVTREYESSAHIASAGPGLLWKIYKGCKRSTKQEASIFVFEKRQLEKRNKSDRDFILESLRRGIQQLTKIRHPQVLTVQHPLEESRESLAFATEPVFASLANVLGETNNMPQPANMSDYKLFDIEVKYGLLQITEGLAFLHNDVKLLHKNICPENIVINSSGAWKLFGLDFCVHNTNPPNSAPNYAFQDYSPTLPDVCQPNLNYLAPEGILSQSHTPASDMFSLGMLTYAMNSREKQCLMPIKEFGQFRNRAQQLKNLNSNKLACIPGDLREFVRLLLSASPEVRPDAHQFLRIPYFDDVCVKTLTYLDSLLQWDNVQKSQFYKGLPDALSKFPQRVKLQRVLACIVRDLGQPIMVPFILPSIFDIAQECTQEEYCTFILPHLKPLMKLMEPIQILLLMLKKMELLLKLTPATDIQQHVLPMLYRGLDSDSPQIHELCLTVLPTFAGMLDHANVKNSLLPRIKKLCLSTTTLSVRVNCLLCIGKILEHLDKWLVIDEVLPFLPQIPSREPAVLMGILGIYKLAMNHKKLGISKEIVATRILPFLIPLCIENGLSMPQFNAMVQLVKDMFQLVEKEHRSKLEQLNSVKDEQKVLVNSMANVVSNTNTNSTSNDFSKDFKGLVLDDPKEFKQKQDKKAEFAPMAVSPDTSTPLSKSKGANVMDDWLTTPPKSNNTSLNTSLASPKPSQTTFNNSITNSNFGYKLQNTISSPNTPMNQYGLGQFNANISQMASPQQNTFGNWASNQPTNRNYPNYQNQNANWGALDSLLPSSNTSKVPLNQMVPSQPLLGSTSASSNQSNNNGNQLSKEDIMDLLS